MDSSDMICLFRRDRVSFQSQQFKEEWLKIEESSTLTIGKPLKGDDWQYLMKILSKVDVSRVEHLVLELPYQEHFCGSPGFLETDLGQVLGTGRFSALKTLRILVTLRTQTMTFDWDSQTQTKSGGLEGALRLGLFTKLRTLSLPVRDVNALFKALTQAYSSPLISLTIIEERYKAKGAKEQVDHQVWDAVLKQKLLKSLQHFDLSGFNQLANLIIKAIISGLLPNVTSLRLAHSGLRLRHSELRLPHSNMGMAGLVKAPKNWFCSLESLAVSDIGADEVCSLLDAVLKDISKGLALKVLDLGVSFEADQVVSALVRLVDSMLLSQLQILVLSKSGGLLMDSDAFVSLIGSVRRGKLPNLQKLTWEKGLSRDFMFGNTVAAAIARAYNENPALTAEIDTGSTYVTDNSLLTQVRVYRDRNLRLSGLKKELKLDVGDLVSDVTGDFLPLTGDVGDLVSEDVGDFLPLTGAKVFLCGYPEVGKTKLRRSLLKRLGLWTMFKWETRPNLIKERRTRGIELSRIAEKTDNGEKIDLVLWDLAGQEEYHILHGTFIADLGLAGGKSTTFVLVFRAPYRLEVKEELLYWLRFVASSSHQGVKRHVVIILNCFGGKQCNKVDKIKWMGLIKSFATFFNDLLDIHRDLFIMDVRVASFVQPLKAHLFGHTRALLQDVGVPRICSEIREELKRWSDGQKHGTLPILALEAFEKSWQLKHKETHLAANAIKIGASYLHEIGEIIFFDDKALTKRGSSNRSIIVSDPQWFCKDVVGQLLLPKEMLERESCLEVSADGSIGTDMFKCFFEHSLIEGTKSDDVIAILEQAGLCYTKGSDKIIVPALIREDDYSSVLWEGQGYNGVMGRSLLVQDKERFAIPMTLFRRLQVELAQDVNFGGRSDSGYRAGKSFSNFQVGIHLVLIQFDVDQSDPTDDRIDILVKSMMKGSRNPTRMRLAQVTLICEIMEKLEVLCVSCCPGVKYDRQAIRPWSTKTKTPKMTERKLMSLREMEILLIEGHQHSSWQLDENPVELECFFTEKEMHDILTKKAMVVKGSADANLDLEVLGSPEVSLEETTEVEADGHQRAEMTKVPLTKHANSEQETSSNALSLPEEITDVENRNSHEELAKFIVSTILSHVDKRSRELMVEVKAHQTYSIEEKEKIVPRFMFLSLRKGGPWVISGKALGSRTFHVHLLCESHFDTGLPHEIADQEGIKIRKEKEWVVKCEPWLRWTLEVALVVAKTVGNIYAPGVCNLIPTDMLPPFEGEDNSTKLLLQDEGIIKAKDELGNYGTAEQHVDMKVRLIGQEVVKDLMKKNGHAEFLEKMKLMKVSLKAEVQEPGSSRLAQPSVFWICRDCYVKYGDRAANITPIW